MSFQDLGLRRLRNYADATEADHGETTHAAIKRVARLGARGKCPQNLERDFLRMNKRDLKMMRYEPYTARAPFERSRETGVEFHDVTIFPPHEAFALLYECDREAFHDVFGSPEERKRYWNEMSSSAPWFASHPGSSTMRDEPSMSVPIRTHGDDVAINRGTYNHKSAMVFSIGSPLSFYRSSRSSVLLTFALVLRNTLAATLPVCYYVVRWSFDALFEGKWPEVDHCGKPLTGWRAARAGQLI